MGEIAGVASSLMGAVGSMGGGGGGGGGGAPPMVEFEASEYANAANHILDKALEQAIPYTEKASQFGIEALKNFYQQSRQDVQKAEAKARGDYQQWHDIANSRLEPYRQSGYGALDQMQDILGLPRFAAGSSAVAQAQEMKARRDASLQQMRAAGADLMSKLPNLSEEDRMNLQYAINSGGNPEGILMGLRQMGITSGQQKFKNNFTNPQLKTLGIDIGPGEEEGHITETDVSRPIPSILGDIMNGLADMNNQVYGDFSQYGPTAGAAYQQYLGNRIPTNMSPILAALRGGVSTSNPVATDVYRRS